MSTNNRLDSAPSTITPITYATNYNPDSSLYCNANAMDILTLGRSFYVVQALDATILNPAKFEPFRHSHARFQRDFATYKKWFIRNLAKAMHDYTATVVAGELRHAGIQSQYGIKDYWRAHSTDRNEVFRDAHEYYSATSILEAGVWHFDPKNNRWTGGYGGAKWQQIAKAGLYYGKLPDAVFIDHCVDLSHNNSVYFDKGAGIFQLRSGGDYKSFLDFKYTAPLEDVLGLTVGKELSKLVDRAENIGLITRNPQTAPEIEEYQNNVRSYEERIKRLTLEIEQLQTNPNEYLKTVSTLSTAAELIADKLYRIERAKEYLESAIASLALAKERINEAEQKLKAYRPLRWSAEELEWSRITDRNRIDDDEEEERREEEEDEDEDEEEERDSNSYHASEKHESSDMPLNW